MSTTFKDLSGREYNVALTVAAIKRIRDKLGYDLLGLVSGGEKSQAIKDVLLDPIKAADVLYVAVKPQADGFGVSDEEFGEQLAGEVLANALAALLEGVEVFFGAAQGPEAAEAVRAMVVKRNQIAAKVWSLARAKVEAIDEEVEAVDEGS